MFPGIEFKEIDNYEIIFGNVKVVRTTENKTRLTITIPKSGELS